AAFGDRLGGTWQLLWGYGGGRQGCTALAAELLIRCDGGAAGGAGLRERTTALAAKLVPGRVVRSARRATHDHPLPSLLRRVTRHPAPSRSNQRVAADRLRRASSAPAASTLG